MILLNKTLLEMSLKDIWMLGWWQDNVELGYEIQFNIENKKYTVFKVNVK